MATLLTTTFVKKHFPLWDKYFLDEAGDADETLLTADMELADKELNTYVSVESADELTNGLDLDLLRIIKKYGFDRQHGDTEFEHKPTILKDYEATIERLKNIKNGKSSLEALDPDSTTGSVTMTAKTRRFDEWFNNTEG